MYVQREFWLVNTLLVTLVKRSLCDVRRVRLKTVELRLWNHNADYCVLLIKWAVKEGRAGNIESDSRSLGLNLKCTDGHYWK